MPRPTNPPKAPPKYADAIMVSATVKGKPALSKRLEQAMVEAIKQAMSDGVGLHSPKMKERMMQAHDKVLADERATLEKAAAEAPK